MSDSTPQSFVAVDLFENGIDGWAQRVRAGELTFRQTIEICLSNIEHSAELNAFECINAQQALESAALMDQQLARGGRFRAVDGSTCRYQRHHVR